MLNIHFLYILFVMMRVSLQVIILFIITGQYHVRTDAINATKQGFFRYIIVPLY